MFFFDDTAPAEICTLSLHDALWISVFAIDGMAGIGKTALAVHVAHLLADRFPDGQLFVRLHAHTPGQRSDRKSTRLNSSHANISYAVFCLNKNSIIRRETTHNGTPS